jgi:hypothetical protein
VASILLSITLGLGDGIASSFYRIIVISRSEPTAEDAELAYPPFTRTFHIASSRSRLVMYEKCIEI